MSEDFERLAYEASLRSLDKQERVLEEIRARTGLLLAAASLAASFLGRPAFDHGNDAVVVMALVAFAFTVGASLYVLMPKKDLVFSFSGPRLYEGLYEYKDDLAETYRRLTYDCTGSGRATTRSSSRSSCGFVVRVSRWPSKSDSFSPPPELICSRWLRSPRPLRLLPRRRPA